jgi:hypothetical protein
MNLQKLRENRKDIEQTRPCKATLYHVCSPCPNPALADMDICATCVCTVRNAMRRTLERYGENDLAIELGLKKGK